MDRKYGLAYLVPQRLQEKRLFHRINTTAMNQHTGRLLDNNECVISKTEGEWKVKISHGMGSLGSQRATGLGSVLASRKCISVLPQGVGFLMYSDGASLYYVRHAWRYRAFDSQGSQ